MKRFILPRFFAVTAFAVLIVASGCKAPTIQYQIVQTASLRVMNFAPNCTTPMDVYWEPGTLNPSQMSHKAANILDLLYGEASVYTTSIISAPNGTKYTVDVTPTRDSTKHDIGAGIPITLYPLQKRTIVITLDSNNSNTFLYDTLTDDVQPGNSNPATQTFVRFMNLQPNIGPLSVHVNDPVTGDMVTPSPTYFNGCTPYYPLTTALDTSFAFFVTNSSNQIIARLTYQTFVAGNYYTLVYAGDLCNTPIDNAADTVNDAVDTIRLRAFDDNQNGADQTNPVPLTYRFNIINGLTAGSGVSVTDVGFTVNGADFPEYDNFTVPPIPLDAAGGANESFSSSDNVTNVSYQSGVIPASPATSVSVAAEGLNGTTSVGQLLSASEAFGTSDFAIIPNNSVSFIFYDTINKTTLTSSNSKTIVFSVPDSSYADSATLIFVPGICGPKSAAIQGTLFYYQPNATGNVITTQWNKLAGAAESGSIPHTGKPVYRVAIPAGGSMPIRITDSVYNTSGNHIALSDETFTAYAGGIYEIASVGNFETLGLPNSNCNTLILRVNK